MFNERLKEARTIMGMSQRELADALFLSQQSIWRYESGAATPTPETVAKMSKVLRVPVAWLLEVEDDDISHSERETIKKYRTLDEYGKRAVDAVLDIESQRGGVVVKKRTIPFIGNTFAAGYGDPDLGSMLSEYETDNKNADFAFKVSGDSMEPYLPDGSVQFGAIRQPKDGEVAVLLIDGEFLVKQVCIDSFGNMYLFALNRDRKDTDRTLWNRDDHSVYCFGTVLMERVRLPR